MVLAFHSLDMYLLSCSFWKLSRMKNFFFELAKEINRIELAKDLLMFSIMYIWIVAYRSTRTQNLSPNVVNFTFCWSQKLSKLDKNEVLTGIFFPYLP